MFPDRCEVLVFAQPQRFVYPIFKNGKSALARCARKNGLTVLLNQQISRANTIEIYLRSPLERFLSGINTFCQMTVRDHPHLDQNTVAWFAERYLFLNRHYTTQFSWIVNLARYTCHECKLSLRHVDSLKTLLGNLEPEGISSMPESQRERILQDKNLEMYARLDQSLFALVGNDFTMEEVCTQMRSKDAEAWNYVVQNNLDILAKCIVQD
jgi:hypothetical protein